MLRLLRRAAAVATAALLSATLLPGTASAAVVAPAPPSFGVQFHGMWSSYDDTERALFLDQLAASGATWVRLDVSWAMLQPTSRDSYDLGWGVPFVDRVLEMARARGLKPLVTLWLTPGWANGGAGERTLPTDPADYARAAGWAAQRWAGVVPAWEVWNEPNDDYFLRGADPVAYTRLLQAAYPAIKAGSPTAKVLLGGPNQNDTSWLAKTYAAGARGSFDVMATHPYMAIADQAPELPDDGTRYRFSHLASVHALMAANGDGDKEIWGTEFGWSSHTNTGGETNWERGVTREQQGEYLVRALKFAASTMPYVTHLFWYTDRDYTAGNLQNSNYGLFDNAFRPKPAYAAVKAYLTGAAPSAAPPAAVSATSPSAPSPVTEAPTAEPSTAPAAAPATVLGPLPPVVRSAPAAEPFIGPVVSKGYRWRPSSRKVSLRRR
jgi:hypothetical protein